MLIRADALDLLDHENCSGAESVALRESYDDLTLLATQIANLRRQIADKPGRRWAAAELARLEAIQAQHQEAADA